MCVLKQILDQTIERLLAAEVLSSGALPDVTRLHEVIGKDSAMITVHRFGMGDFFVYLNDRKRDFYGFEGNDASHMNVRFYFSTYHTASYVLLAQAYQFFLRDRQEYLEATYHLKTVSGDYVRTPGVSKAIVRDHKGKVEYIISVTCAEDELAMTRFRYYFPKVQLSGRQQSSLDCLLQGMSNAQISEALGVTEKTAENHVLAVLKATGQPSRKVLADICLGNRVPEARS